MSCFPDDDFLCSSTCKPAVFVCSDCDYYRERVRKLEELNIKLTELTLNLLNCGPKTESRKEQVEKMLIKHSELSDRKIAKILGVSNSTVSKYRRRMISTE